MKKILVLCSILLLVGCSQKEKNDNEYKGEYGTYEIMDTSLIEDYGISREEYAQLQWKIKYTNTTSEPRKPIDSIELDMVIENETDVELNEIPFSRTRHAGSESQLSEEQKLINNGWLNIKPEATVEIIVEATVEEEKIDSMFLRNRNEQGQNGEQFNKKVKNEDLVYVEEKVDTNSDKQLIINVRANQNSWEFSYPNKEVVTSNELVVPANEKVYFNLMPSDSKHSFWIPSAGGKVDTNTDKVNEFWLLFDEEKANELGGIFYGRCAEHGSDMDFTVKAIPRAEFNQWLKEMKNI